MQEQIGAIDAKGPDDVVAGYLGIWRRVVEGTDFRAGCAVTGAVTGGHEPSILERAKEAFDATSDALAALFRKAGLGPDEAARRATLLMYAAEGAVILARAQRSIEPLVFTAEQLSTRPGKWAPPALRIALRWGPIPRRRRGYRAGVRGLATATSARQQKPARSRATQIVATNLTARMRLIISDYWCYAAVSGRCLAETARRSEREPRGPPRRGHAYVQRPGRQ